MSFRRFFWLQVVNCLSWSVIIYAAGHFLGMAALAIVHRFGLAGLLVALCIIAGAGLVGYFRYGHHRLKGLTGKDRDEP